MPDDETQAFQPGEVDPEMMEDEDVTEPTDYKGAIPDTITQASEPTAEVEAFKDAVGQVLTIQPVAEKVTFGIQSIAGYLPAALAFIGSITAAVDSGVLELPGWAAPVLFAIGAVLTALTNQNRTTQRNANTKAAAQVASAALAPVNVQDLTTGETVPAHVVIETRPPS